MLSVHLTTGRTAALFGTATTFALLVLNAHSPVLTAQAPVPTGAPLTFDVASIKPSDPDARGGMISGPAPSQFTVKNMSLDRIIMYAWGLRDFQLTGGPGWVHSDRFDIVAKYPQGWSTSQGPAQVPLMVRALLDERFRLTMHPETRQGPIYALVMARSDRRLGPRLRPTAIDCAKYIAAEQAAGRQVVSSGGMTTCLSVSSDQFIRASVRPIGILATLLSARVGRPVVDRTQLNGNFDIELEWSPELPAATPGTGVPSPPVDDKVSIFTALQEQLGLKLESERGPIDMWIIDAVEPPSPD
jgi:uncharacterized protein (TIGR03435 family)